MKAGHFLANCVWEGPRWPMQDPNKGRMQKAKKRDRSSLLILYLKEDNLYYSGKEEGGKTFYKFNVHKVNDELLDRVSESVSETWKGLE